MIQMFFIAMATGSLAAKGKTEPEKPKTFWQKLEVGEFFFYSIFVGLPALALTASWLALIYIVGISLR